MSNISNDGIEAAPRIHCLDFLRGFFVFLALWQHFGYYLNYWYLDYYQGWSYWGNAFAPHVDRVGEHIYADWFGTWAAWFFTPWVSQVYLFLASFNLAKRNQDENRISINNKLIIFGCLFLLFTFENFLVAPNIGEALSLYPLQTWMLTLALVLFSYSFLGEKAVWFLAIFGIVRLALPFDDFYQGVESIVHTHLHKNFEIDARPEYFLTSAALGFLMGRSWWQGKIQQLYYWGSIGVILWLIWLIFGESFVVFSQDVFATEHVLARTFLGSLGIHGIELMVVSIFLLLQFKGFDVKLKLINWIGINSLLVFFLHRIIFVKIYMPIRILIASYCGVPLTGSFVEDWIGIGVVVLCAWFIRRAKLLSFLEGRS